MNITLIGMPGSGKSYVGERLADALGYGFIDPDKKLERLYGKPLQVILDTLGEAEFMTIEADMTLAAIEHDDNTILSTGGSIVYSTETMQKLALVSRVVYLQVPLYVLVVRIGHEPRGIIGLQDKSFEQLYEERRPLYEKLAAVTTDGTQRPDKVVMDIMQKMGISSITKNI